MCPACGSAASSPLEVVVIEEQSTLYAGNNSNTKRRLRDLASKAAIEYHMYQCRQCGLEYADPMKAPPTEWYDLAYKALNLYPTSRWEFSEALRHMRPNERVLEFGCGSGEFLKLCRARDIKAVGLDFAENAIMFCRAAGLEAYRAQLADCVPTAKDLHPTQLVAFHVLEHLEAPKAFFQLLSEIANREAKLWISIPSQRRHTRRFGVTDFLDQPPHHLTRWTESGLREIGKSTGWTLEELTFEPISLRAALWSIATRSSRYLALKQGGKLTRRFYERFMRLCLYPAAAYELVTLHQDLSGFSMLARYGR